MLFRSTKVAVFSNQSGVDPVGSCVGQKGVRVQAVIGELGGNEKVDIIQWSEDIQQFITAAIAPAKDLIVKLNEKKKAAEVYVSEDQLSLAIGRDGQNVRLAAKVTGWKIDIKSKNSEEKKEFSAASGQEADLEKAKQKGENEAEAQDKKQKPTTTEPSGNQANA